MKTYATKLKLAVLGAGVLATVGTAQATVFGSLWDSTDSGLNSGNQNVPTSPPATPANVTFTLPNGPFDMNSLTLGYTIAQFLTSGGATILTGASDPNGMNNCLIQITGQVTMVNGQTYEVTHDDGIILSIDGQTPLNLPAPNQTETSTFAWSGLSGTYSFNLLYDEVAGPPARLQTNLPLMGIPEPTTVLAGAMLLLPLGMSALRILRKDQKA
jgi:hypothetical protein